MTMTSKFSVGRFTCEMSWSPTSGINCEWSPDFPQLGSLEEEAGEYRAERDAFLQEVASTLGGNVMVVEV